VQRPLRAIVYGFLVWWLWFGFIGVSRLLPADVTSGPAFPSVRLLVLVLLVVVFAVDYLRRVGRTSVGEGLAVGITWALLLIANDIGHSLFMEPVDLGRYLTTFAPLYAWVPAALAVMFGWLSAPSDEARRGGAAD